MASGRPSSKSQGDGLIELERSVVLLRDPCGRLKVGGCPNLAQFGAQIEKAAAILWLEGRAFPAGKFVGGGGVDFFPSRQDKAGAIGRQGQALMFHLALVKSCLEIGQQLFGGRDFTAQPGRLTYAIASLSPLEIRHMVGLHRNLRPQLGELLFEFGIGELGEHRTRLDVHTLLDSLDQATGGGHEDWSGIPQLQQGGGANLCRERNESASGQTGGTQKECHQQTGQPDIPAGSSSTPGTHCRLQRDTYHAQATDRGQ